MPMRARGAIIRAAREGIEGSFDDHLSSRSLAGPLRTKTNLNLTR